jgi:hypothetical protein
MFIVELETVRQVEFPQVSLMRKAIDKLGQVAALG